MNEILEIFGAARELISSINHDDDYKNEAYRRGKVEDFIKVRNRCNYKLRGTDKEEFIIEIV